jgi:hypothetical protein
LKVIRLGKSISVEQVLVDIDQARKTGELPNLIVVDQMLTLSSSGGVIQKGSSFAVTLRDRNPKNSLIPLVGVTGAPLSEVAELQRRQFIEFFPRDDLQSGARVPDLYSIADGFAALLSEYYKASSRPISSKSFLRLFDTPEEDAPLLLNCIPGEFKSVWDEGTPHEFAQWIWHTFMARPGFLYDDIETSTLLGLNQDGFSRLWKQLVQCRYDGAFASAGRVRWWVSKIRQKTRELTRAVPTDPIWTLGRQLVGDKSQFFSKCLGMPVEDAVPNVVAFADGTLRKRVQTRLEYAEPLETDSPPLGFEQRYVCLRK